MKTPTKPPRTFIPESANLDQWETLEPLLTDLRDRALTDLSALRKWVADLSEFEAVMEEHVAWKYIKMTIDTSDEALTKDYQHFISEIQRTVWISHTKVDYILSSTSKLHLDFSNFSEYIVW